MPQPKGAPRTPEETARLVYNSVLDALKQNQGPMGLGVKLMNPRFMLTEAAELIREVESAARAEGFQEGAAWMREKATSEARTVGQAHIKSFALISEKVGADVTQENIVDAISALPLTEEGV